MGKQIRHIRKIAYGKRHRFRKKKIINPGNYSSIWLNINQKFHTPQSIKNIEQFNEAFSRFKNAKNKIDKTVAWDEAKYFMQKVGPENLNNSKVMEIRGFS